MVEEQITELNHRRNNEMISNTLSINIDNPIEKKPPNKRKQSERNNDESRTTIRSMSQLYISQQQLSTKFISAL